MFFGLLISFGSRASAQTDSARATVDPKTGTYYRTHGGVECELDVEILSTQSVRFRLTCLHESPPLALGSAAGVATLTGSSAEFTASSDSGTCTLRFTFEGKRVVLTQTGPRAPCRIDPSINSSGTYRHFRPGKPLWDVRVYP